jgi:hypothetical protein
MQLRINDYKAGADSLTSGLKVILFHAISTAAKETGCLPIELDYHKFMSTKARVLALYERDDGYVISFSILDHWGDAYELYPMFIKGKFLGAKASEYAERVARLAEIRDVGRLSAVYTAPVMTVKAKERFEASFEPKPGEDLFFINPEITEFSDPMPLTVYATLQESAQWIARDFDLTYAMKIKES